MLRAAPLPALRLPPSRSPLTAGGTGTFPSCPVGVRRSAPALSLLGQEPGCRGSAREVPPWAGPCGQRREGSAAASPPRLSPRLSAGLRRRRGPQPLRSPGPFSGSRGFGPPRRGRCRPGPGAAAPLRSAPWRPFSHLQEPARVFASGPAPCQPARLPLSLALLGQPWVRVRRLRVTTESQNWRVVRDLQRSSSSLLKQVPCSRSRRKVSARVLNVSRGHFTASADSTLSVLPSYGTSRALVSARCPLLYCCLPPNGFRLHRLPQLKRCIKSNSFRSLSLSSYQRVSRPHITSVALCWFGQPASAFANDQPHIPWFLLCLSKTSPELMMNEALDEGKKAKRKFDNS